jgi:hypothetical protein
VIGEITWTLSGASILFLEMSSHPVGPNGHDSRIPNGITG